MNFATPEELGKYLLHLDENDNEYMKYHTWRLGKPDSFDLSYLRKVQTQLPGKKEKQAHSNLHNVLRGSSCCRLCNPDFVKQAAMTRHASQIVPAPLGQTKIEHAFYSQP